MVITITNDERERAAELRQYAEDHPLTMDDLLATKLGYKDPIGDNENHVMYMGAVTVLRLVFSIEEQVKGKVRHLSISVEGDKDLLPAPIIVELEIMPLFGMKNLAECVVYKETVGPDRTAINIIDKKSDN